MKLHDEFKTYSNAWYPWKPVRRVMQSPYDGGPCVLSPPANVCQRTQTAVRQRSRSWRLEWSRQAEMAASHMTKRHTWPSFKLLFWTINIIPMDWSSTLFFSSGMFCFSCLMSHQSLVLVVYHSDGSPFRSDHLDQAKPFVLEGHKSWASLSKNSAQNDTEFMNLQHHRRNSHGHY